MKRFNSPLLSGAAVLALTCCRIEAQLPADPNDAHAGAAGSPVEHTAAGSGASRKPSSGAAGSSSRSGRGARSSDTAAQDRAAGGGSAPQSAGDSIPPSDADDSEAAEAWDEGVPQEDSAAVGVGEIPSALLGGWYASNGGTSIPFDPDTGEFGMQNGSGLYYRFAADGSYQKAFQSYASNAGCTTGFHAEESGSMQVTDGTLLLVPAGGEIHYRDNCSPSLDSDRSEDNLSTEQFTWELSDGGLRLTRSDGASSVFVRTDK